MQNTTTFRQISQGNISKASDRKETVTKHMNPVLSLLILVPFYPKFVKGVKDMITGAQMSHQMRLMSLIREQQAEYLAADYRVRGLVR